MLPGGHGARGAPRPAPAPRPPRPAPAPQPARAARAPRPAPAASASSGTGSGTGHCTTGGCRVGRSPPGADPGGAPQPSLLPAPSRAGPGVGDRGVAAWCPRWPHGGAEGLHGGNPGVLPGAQGGGACSVADLHRDHQARGTTRRGGPPGARTTRREGLRVGEHQGQHRTGLGAETAVEPPRGQHRASCAPPDKPNTWLSKNTHPNGCLSGHRAWRRASASRGPDHAHRIRCSAPADRSGSGVPVVAAPHGGHRVRKCCRSWFEGGHRRG